MTVKNNDNDQLIETMTSLILIYTHCGRYTVLSLEPIINQIKDPFLQQGLLMVSEGCGAKYIKETLNAQVNPKDVYKNLVLEGLCMISKGLGREMQEKFKTYLSTEDQVKLEVTIKGVLDDWKDHSETIEGGNQVIIEHLKQHEK